MKIPAGGCLCPPAGLFSVFASSFIVYGRYLLLSYPPLIASSHGFNLPPREPLGHADMSSAASQSDKLKNPVSRAVLFGGFAGAGVSPAQAGEFFIIAVGGNPFAASFNGQCRKPDIGNQIPGGRLGLAQIDEDLPVVWEPGAMIRQLGCSRSSRTNSSAETIGLGGVNMRGWVTTRRKPLNT